MHVALVAINARWTHSNLALRYLRNALAPFDAHQVQLLELTINQDSNEILDQVLNLKADVLMVSVYIWNASQVHTLLNDLLSLTIDTRVFLGGPEVSWNPEPWLVRHKNIWGIIQGPGEEAMAYLANKGFDPGPSKIINIHQGDFSSIPNPWLPGEVSELRDRYIYYESSRGCPHRCSYCLSSREDIKLSFKDSKQVQEELGSILAQGPMTVKFVDRTFNAKPARAREIWEWIITWVEANHEIVYTPRSPGPSNVDARRKTSMGPTMKFHFEIQPGLLGQKDLDLLRLVPKGLFQFEVGIQSTNPQTAQRIRRPVLWPRCKPILKAIMDLGTIDIDLDIIAGLPGEGLLDLGQTFDDLMDLRPQHIHLGFLKVLPGTPIADEVQEWGLSYRSDPPYQVLRTNTISTQEMALLRTLEKILTPLLGDQGCRDQYFHALETGSPFSKTLNLLSFLQGKNWDFSTCQGKKLLPLLDAWIREDLPRQ